MSSRSHPYGIVVTAGERQQLVRLLEQHGPARQQEQLGHLVSSAPDFGSISALAATVETPERMLRVQGVTNGATGGFSERQAGEKRAAPMSNGPP